MPETFEQVIRRYHQDGVICRSPGRKPIHFWISSVDSLGFTLAGPKNSSYPCSFDELNQKLAVVRESNGHVPLHLFDALTAKQVAYLQAPDLGVSLDRREVLDLSDTTTAVGHFRELLKELNVNKSGETVRLYKPIIMWCVLDGVRSGELNENRIDFEWLVPRFVIKSAELGAPAKAEHAAEAFYHLTSETFWLLAYLNPENWAPTTPNAAQVRRDVRHAVIKETYWRLLTPDLVTDLLGLIETHWFKKGPLSEPHKMNIDLKLLDLAVKNHIKPVLIDEGHLNDPHLEGYHHQKILPKVRPLLTRQSIESDPSGSLLGAFKAHVNLLSQYELMAAIAFIDAADVDVLRERTVDLLYGPDAASERIARFWEWSKVKNTPSGKIGIGVTPISYLLAMSDPTLHAFCKPSIYKAAAKALLHGYSSHGVSRTERLVQATAFYNSALRLFQERYNLPFTDLLHVHIAFFIMTGTVDGIARWHFLPDKTPLPPPLTHDLNLIAYGPPGTGKTYDTLRRAVEICDGIAPDERQALVRRFNKLREENRIAFVTFHQAFGYEDFVEGIRPVLQDAEEPDNAETNAQVRYECRPGIFKRLCTLAKTKAAKHDGDNDIDWETVNVWKMSLGNNLDPEQAEIYDECIDNNYLLLGYGKGVNFEGCDNRTAILERLRAEDTDIPQNAYDVAAIDILKNRMQVGDLVIISDGNRQFRAIARITGDYAHIQRESYQQTRPVEWLVVFDESLPRETILSKSFSQMTLYQLRKQDLKLDVLRELMGTTEDISRKYVLIIDEINRGNVAKVFGELITLLEADKRLGGENELQVTLPYSGDSFGVPGNVYIIGTMNTADRSIAFLDVALRRRFQFVEVMPNPDLIRELVGDEGEVDGIDVSQLLQVINDRIELLYDRDHQIGHAFFLSIESLLDLRDVFCGKIIPLLQEYFYGDWGKVCLILGCPISENGKQKANAIIASRRLKAADLVSGGDDFVEDKFRCDVSPVFATTSSVEVLRQHFAGLMKPDLN